jgi:copper(I)-binding protein
MHLRRSVALTAGSLVLLTSCGFDLATDRPYTPGEGTNEQGGDVELLAAVIVAAQPNEGTVVVTLSNSTAEEQALSGVSGPDLEVAEFDPIEIAPRSFVNLADLEDGVLVSGDFDAGAFLPLTFSFESGEQVSFEVPVVTACDEFEGLDLTEGSTNIPYDCEAEPEAPGHGGGAEEETGAETGEAEGEVAE